MLFAEWNQEEALAVHYAEGREEGREEGLEVGLEKGREEGMEEGLKKTAINALSKGFSIEVIQSITGLDEKTIRSLEAN